MTLISQGAGEVGHGVPVAQVLAVFEVFEVGGRCVVLTDRRLMFGATYLDGAARAWVEVGNEMFGAPERSDGPFGSVLRGDGLPSVGPLYSGPR